MYFLQSFFQYSWREPSKVLFSLAQNNLVAGLTEENLYLATNMLMNFQEVLNKYENFDERETKIKETGVDNFVSNLCAILENVISQNQLGTKDTLKITKLTLRLCAHLEDMLCV